MPPTVAAAAPPRVPDEDPALAAARKRELISLHRQLKAHRLNDIFGFPVAEEDAPGYSEIVPHPMDYVTLKTMIDDGRVRRGKRWECDTYWLY